MILNEEYLRNYLKNEMRHSINESFNQMLKFSENVQYDIFISHSNLDKELVCALYDLFKENGFTPYIDYADRALTPTDVTSSTGKILRERLGKCKCLAYISTENIAKSKWCPWELGLFDGISDGKCCILPIMKTKQHTYNGQEYLGMYPYLDYERYKDSDKYTFWVNDPDDSKKYIELRNWISGNQLKIHK